MTTKCNELSQKILREKYYAPDEKCPEDLFRRVADVCSIPDVIDVYATSNYIHKSVIDALGKYNYLAERVCNRRNITITDKDSIEFSDGKGFNLYTDKVSECWKSSADKYFNAMANLDFMPATPTLMNAGVGGMLSSCFAIKVPDSMEGIFETVKQVAIISQKGGGCGLSVSDLRPEGSPVGKRGGVSSGPISFLKVFNETGNQVKQGGSRRAALLAGLSVYHPDIEKFISCKAKEGDLSNFNLSVFIPDSFMSALKLDETITLKHDKSTYEKKIRAKELWSNLCNACHSTGEPGIIFQDRLDKDDVVRGKYGNLLVNPCGELPLHNYSSCNLASINLLNIYDSETNDVDLIKLETIVNLVIRFLDNVVDINNYPLKEIEDRTLALRPIGLGIMGLHDLFLSMGIPYGDEKSIALIDQIYNKISIESTKVSKELANIRGIPLDLKEFNIDRRNAFLLTVPPTGTTSIICNQVSSGIEPNFQWEYTRKDSYGEHKIKHFILERFSDELPAYAKTALEISPEDHVKVQSTVQKYLDESVSKTVNLHNSATVEDVDKIFKLAYTTGCKSITAYRSGSRKEEVLVAKEKNTETIKELDKVDSTTVRTRPRILWGATFMVNGPGKVFLTINEDKKGVREVFLHVAKAGSEVSSHVETEGRLISTALKHNVPVSKIISQLIGIRSTPVWDNGRLIKSLPDAIAKTLQEYVESFEGFSQYLEEPNLLESVKEISNKKEYSGDFCVECGEPMYYEGGCATCYNCGNSRCG